MESRTAAQIREHYEIEKEIALRLRNSGDPDRRKLYGEAYDELFRRVSDHPLLHNASKAENDIRIAREVRNLERFLNSDTVYLEVGPGDCAVAVEVASHVKKVFAVDVSEVVTSSADRPDNFELIISNGIEIPLGDESVDFAYSNQLMEHLHPDDSFAQLREIFRVLRPGGRYFCITPNRLSGPHDISRSFDDEATCLHLREFTVSELDKMFRDVGFRETFVYLKYRSFDVRIPVLPFKVAEKLIGALAHRIRKLLTYNKVVRFALGVKLLGVK